MISLHASKMISIKVVLSIYILLTLFGEAASQGTDKFTGMASIAQMMSYPEEISEISHNKYRELMNGQKQIWSNLMEERLASDAGIQDGDRVDLVGEEEAISDYTGPSSGLMAAPNTNVSEICLNHIMIFREALLQPKEHPWALSMLDATGKLPSGVLEGNLVWRGAYRECLNVTAVIYSNITLKSDPVVPFHGRYCRLSIPLEANASTAAPLGPAAMFGTTPTLMIGMCVPDSCDGPDIVGLVNLGLSVIPIQLPDLPLHADCPEKPDLSEDTGAIVVIVILCCIGGVILMGTCYDIVLFQIPEYLAQLPSDSSGLINGYLPVPTEAPDTITDHSSSEKTYLLRNPSNKGEDAGQIAPGLCGRLLLTFSVYSNGLKILSTEKSAGSLTCIHGVRFLSMTWVILGHTYVFGLTAGDNLGTFLVEMTRRWTFQGVSNATFSVDSFFLLSGLLVGFLTLKEMDKRRGKLNWFMFYFHRFWRLTPPYMLVLMVYVPLFKYWSDGPLWPVTGIEPFNCNTWWTNLLYINNLVKPEEMCMGWSWYLSNDMQFYVISPLILIPLYYSGIIGSVIVLVLFIGTFVITGVLSNYYGAGTGILGGNVLAFFQYIYGKPYCRIGPYLVGLLIGYLLYRTKCRVRMNFILVLIGWIAAVGCCLSVLYGLYDADTHGTRVLSPDVNALYSAVSRTVWAVGLGWLIFACCNGYGGFVNTLLSWGAFIPLSRLTYTAYLIHPVLMYVYYGSLETPINFTDLTVIYMFLGHLVLTYMVAFVVSLAFEAPMMGLEKVLLNRGKKS